jgi:hypothetical protein
MTSIEMIKTDRDISFLSLFFVHADKKIILNAIWIETLSHNTT